MPDLALYRKYRPYNFKNLVGQDNIKSALVNAIKAGKQSHAYLFSGPRGTGKTTTARLLAKAFNCGNLQEGYEPCNECEICNAINDGNLIDLIEIDAASNRGIDEIRDLREKINFAPSRAKIKVYIIDEVHMLTKEAFNALLKTLEEPPSYVYFILATTEIHKVPETIISRCQRFDFKRIDEKALMTRLGYIAQLEGIEAEDKAIEAIARHVEGSLRDAIQLLEQLNIENKLTFEHVKDILGITDFETLDRLFESLMGNDTEAALATVQDVHSQGYDLNQFCHEFIDLVRGKLLDAVNNEDEESVASYLKIIDIFQKAKDRLKTFTITQLPLEIAVIEATKNLSGTEVKAPKQETPAKKDAEPKKETIPKQKSSGIVIDQELFASKEESEEKTVESIKTAFGKEPEAENSDRVEDMDNSKNISPDLESSSLTLAHVKENWPRIVERIEIPACKRSIVDGGVAKVENNEILIEFKSNFHRNKVMEHDNRIEVERIFKEVFGHDVKIIGKVKEIEIGSAVSSDQDEESEDFAKSALEVFGGEFVDEE